MTKPFVPKTPQLLEADHARQLALWLDRRKILFVHVPNEGVRSVMGNVDAQRQGLQPGAPDYLIFSMPAMLRPGGGFWRGTAIELKKIGWKPRNARDKLRFEKQKNFLKALADVGWAARVCYGWEDAVKFLQELGYE